MFAGVRHEIEDAMAFVVEVGIQASRIFYTEVKWKTLSSITLLPKGIGNVAYAKIAGTAISLLPAIGLFLVGAACDPEGFGEGLEDFLTEPVAWYTFSQAVLFAHLAALLSLYVKWGAFPLTFALVYGGNILMIFVLSTVWRGGLDDAIFAMSAIMTFIACFPIQFKVAGRLRQLAAM